MQTFQLTIGEGRHRVDLLANLTGRGINILVTGGESPHIGAVVLCIPREKDKGTGLGTDTWTMPVPGHKDFHVAQSLGELISTGTGQVTVVSAGIHMDNAEGWEIELVCSQAERAAQMFLQQYTDGVKTVEA
ncbi:MAG TPA: hypothetical protein VNU93_02455 [Verrucomicrobiae bacterium]|nr:hypothetical protein [Verrucomicrobiae bacterium]